MAKKIIKDFTGSLSEEEKVELEKRLIVVQWQDGMKEIEEVAFFFKFRFQLGKSLLLEFPVSIVLLV